MFKKISKKVTVATMLLSSITSNNFAVAKEQQLNSVQQYANTVHALAKKDASVEDVFAALSKLTGSIEKVNEFLASQKFKLAKSSFGTLVAIRQLLEFNSTLLVSKYEQDILSKYRTTYRQYSLSIKQLDDSIYQIREKLGLIEVADINGLSLTDEDLKTIHQQAKARIS